MSWEANRDFIISQMEAGTADQGMQEWYDRWKYSGSPTTKAGMLTITQYENKKRYDEYQAQQQAEQEEAAAAEAELDLDRPDGVSRYLWERVKSGSLDYNLTSVINNPEVRDAIVEAGYGDYVKAVHEKAMDDRAAHYMGNGASAGDAWNTAQYDWYNQQYGDYGNTTVSTSSGDDLGFGGGSEVDNTDYNNQAAADAQAAAGNEEEYGWMETDDWDSLTTWEKNAKHIVNQVNSGKATEGQQSWYDTWTAAGSPETQAGLQDWKQGQAAAAQAQADAAAAEQAAAAEKEQYLQSVNEGMQVGIYGNNPGTNPWANPNAGGQGMFGQAYGQAKAAQQQPMPQQAMPQQAMPQQAMPQQAVPKSTPFADAYIKAKQAAEQPNAVTSMFKNELSN